jgi:hypothetical protein
VHYDSKIHKAAKNLNHKRSLRVSSASDPVYLLNSIQHVLIKVLLCAFPLKFFASFSPISTTTRYTWPATSAKLGLPVSMPKMPFVVKRGLLTHAKLTLRLVSRRKVFIPMPPLTKCYTALFDSVILGKTMFPHELPVKPSTCYRTPPRIREKYLLCHIKQHVELLELTDYTLLSDSKTGTWGRAAHNRSDKW